VQIDDRKGKFGSEIPDERRNVCADDPGINGVITVNKNRAWSAEVNSRSARECGVDFNHLFIVGDKVCAVGPVLRF
jgi:hypothetical protein